MPRVVEQTPGRRPDPRGPKPPSFGSIEREPVIAIGIENEVDERPARDTEAAAAPAVAVAADRVWKRAEVNAAGDEIDWIEAAARAGIAAADAADSDDEEFGHADPRPPGTTGRRRGPVPDSAGRTATADRSLRSGC